MPLTAEQKSKLKKILANYRLEVKSIVAKHKKQVVQAVDDADRRKADRIKQQIEKT